MATICDNPYTIPPIDIDECVGSSLATLNSNFQELKNNTCLTFSEIEEVQSDLVELSAKYQDFISYVPSFIAAKVSFNGTNTSIYTQLNVASVSALGTGMYALSFTTAFPTSGYALIGTCQEKRISGFPTNTYVWVQPTTFTTTTAVININDEDGNFIDPEYVSIIIYNN